MSRGESYKQDLLVSIRYRNDLPPPPMPPKLLDIDTGGLQQYLDPGFAASIAKREEPNIEADAEGGMPIDVIGMYGYFEGDESSIMAPEIAPPLDPDDEALMLSPEQLKAGGIVNTSNFLRKTQYMTATAAPTTEAARIAASKTRKTSVPKPQVPLTREDPENIKRNIQKAFDLAYPASRKDPASAPIAQAERTAWEKPVHPANNSLKPVGFYPILPDLDANTIIGSSWNLLRFEKPPLPAYKGRRDDRIDAGFLTFQSHPDRHDAYQQALDAHEREPHKYEHPGNEPAVWSLFVPRDHGSTSALRAMFNSQDPNHSDGSLLARIGDTTPSGDLRVPLERARFYANTKSEDKPQGRHTRQVIITLKNGGDINQPGQAHYYPIGQINLLKSDRGKLGQSQGRLQAQHNADLEASMPDQLMVLPEDPSARVLATRYVDRPRFDPTFQARYNEIEAAGMAEQEAMDVADRKANGDTGDGVNGQTEAEIVPHTSQEKREDVEMDDADADHSVTAPVRPINAAGDVRPDDDDQD